MESCVGVAPQSALLSRSFTDAAAIARALSFSLHASDTATEPPAAAFARGAAETGNYHPPPAPMSSSSSARTSRLGPAGGRAEKRRRPRPSKRAPTTYISTDAATFRLMVQRVTGADDEPGHDAHGLGLGILLPHLGVVGPLAPSAAHDAAATAYASLPPAPAAPEQPLFPTLDSWNVMSPQQHA